MISAIISNTNYFTYGPEVRWDGELHVRALAYRNSHYEADALLRRVPVLSPAIVQEDSALLLLPTELFLQILSNIKEPDLSNLKLTCKDLFCFIPPIRPYVRAPFTLTKTFTLSPAIPQTNSPFFRLSPDVRNQILHYVGQNADDTRSALQTCKAFYARLINYRYPELKRIPSERGVPQHQSQLFVLPNEIIQIILHQLPSVDFLRCREVCNALNRLVLKDRNFIARLTFADRRLSMATGTIFDLPTDHSDKANFDKINSPLKAAPRLLTRLSLHKSLKILMERHGIISRVTYRKEMVESLIYRERILRYLRSEFARAQLQRSNSQHVVRVGVVANAIFQRTRRQLQEQAVQVQIAPRQPIQRPVRRPIGAAAQMENAQVEQTQKLSEDPEPQGDAGPFDPLNRLVSQVWRNATEQFYSLFNNTVSSYYPLRNRVRLLSPD